ncbi:hypothetical protein TNCV_2635751 [Trichonephila clavipes]|nr:hypothetical protein TNCV_2635751 [Trichonephila clavipes]
MIDEADPKGVEILLICETTAFVIRIADCGSDTVAAIEQADGKSETFLRFGVNEKFCVTVEKTNGSSLLPHPTSRPHGDMIASAWKRKERGHHVTYGISEKKFDDCPPLQLLNLPTFRLGVLFPRPGNIPALRCRQNSSLSKSVPF